MHHYSLTTMVSIAKSDKNAIKVNVPNYLKSQRDIKKKNACSYVTNRVDNALTYRRKVNEISIHIEETIIIVNFIFTVIESHFLILYFIICQS